MVYIKDYSCDRDRLVNIWLRHPKSECVISRAMKEMVAVEELSRKLMEMYGFNLIHVSTTAAMLYIRLKDEDLKMRVLKRIEIAIKSLVDPNNDEPLGVYGLTVQMVTDLIESERTGKPANNRIYITYRLNKHEHELIESMLACVLSKCKQSDLKDEFIALGKKIRGL